jgi:membrane associated rhomboid family serine protease
MGASDRDYFRDEERRYSGGSGRPPLPPVTKWLLIANVVIFLIDVFTRPGPNSLMPDFGIINSEFCFTIDSALRKFKLWELVTFQFLHASLLHVVFNCIGIWVFGPWVERWWGSRRFLVFYLLCGVAGGLCFTLLSLIGVLPRSDIYTPLVGASAGLYGMMLSIAVINPHTIVHLLLPPVDLTLRKLALIMLGIAVFVILGDNLLGWAAFQNSGGEAGHLGGAILGYLLTRYPQALRKKGKDAEEKIIRPKEFRKRRLGAKLRPRTSIDVATSSDVDRILDKISREGIQSLTDEEREILHQASKPTKER